MEIVVQCLVCLLLPGLSIGFPWGSTQFMKGGSHTVRRFRSCPGVQIKLRGIHTLDATAERIRIQELKL